MGGAWSSECTSSRAVFDTLYGALIISKVGSSSTCSSPPYSSACCDSPIQAAVKKMATIIRDHIFLVFLDRILTHYN
jgi:hypothetical protein